MPGTLLVLVRPRIRSRFCPAASVVICVSKFALAPVTAPPPSTVVQPKLVAPSLSCARMLPSARLRSAAVQPLVS